jgi:pimeloyl-ACP methyl ester carboxylesterase
VVLTFVAYASVCAYMALTLTTPKRQAFAHTPEQYGAVYETVTFPSRVDRLPLEGWLLQPAGAAGPALPGTTARRPVVVVHGRGGDRQDSAFGRTVEIGAYLADQGRPVLLFDLRGSGRSGGARFTLGAQEVRDVGGAIDFLTRRGLADDGVALLGYSMGGATALLAARDELSVREVVDDSGYAELGDILERRVPLESGLPRFFTPGVVLMAWPLIGVNAYDIRPVEAAPVLAARGVPLLVIHGEADDFIPVNHGRRIASAYGPGAATYFVPGAEHTGGYRDDPATYLRRLTDFLDRTG